MSATPTAPNGVPPLTDPGQVGTPPAEGQDLSAELRELREIVGSLRAQAQGQSAIIAKLQRQQTAPQPPSESHEPAPAKPSADPMVDRFKEFEQTVGRQKRAATLSAFREALVSEGLDVGTAKEVSRWLARDNEALVDTELNDDGEYVVSVSGAPIGEWLRAYTESDAGRPIRALRQSGKAPLPIGHRGAGEAAQSSGPVKLDPLQFSVKVAEAVARGRREGKPPSEYMKGFELQKE